MRRTWQDANGASVHHLLDPATGHPLQKAIQATVVAGTAAWAEVFTKMVMVRGVAALEELDSVGLGARVVLSDRSAHCNKTWQCLELHCIRS